MLDLEHLCTIFRQSGSDALVEELRMYGDLTAPIIALIERMSSTLEERPEQLATQVVGLVLGLDDPLLADMVERADRVRGAWLRPLCAYTGEADPRLSSAITLADNESVSGLAFLPDGTLVSSDEGGALRLWDVDTMTQRRVIECAHDCIDAMVLAADGTRLITLYEDIIEVWDTDTWTVVHSEKQAHTDIINEIARGPGGLFASAGDDNAIKLWSLESGVVAAIWKTESPQAVAFSPDGRRAASASYDSLSLWDVASGRVLAMCDDSDKQALGHDSAPDTLLWLDDERLLSATENIVLWRASDFSQQLRLPGHPGTLNQMLPFAGGRRMVSVAEDIRVWDLEQGVQLAAFTGHDHNDVQCVAMSRDEQVMVTGDFMGEIKVWDVQKVLDTPATEGHVGEIRSVAITRHGELALSVGSDGAAILWDARSASIRCVLRTPGTLLEGGCFVGDERYALTYSNNALQLWDVASGELVRTLENSAHEGYDIDDVRVSRDGDVVVSSDSASAIALWDLEAEEVRLLHRRMSDAEPLLLTDDGQLFLTWDRSYDEDDDDEDELDDDEDELDDDEDGFDDDEDELDDDEDEFDDDEDGFDDDEDEFDDDEDEFDDDEDEFDDDEDEDDERGSALPVELWDLETHEVVRVYRPEKTLADDYETETPTHVLLTPDEDRVIAATSCGGIYVWDRDSGMLERVMRADVNDIDAMWLTEIGHLAAADSVNECIRIWDIDTGELVQEVQTPGPQIDNLHPTSDGDRVAMCVEDETMVVMEIPSGRILGSFTGSCDISALALSDDGLTVVIGDSRGRVLFFDVVDSK